MQCKAVHILDMINLIGEQNVKDEIASFSCPLNAEIEEFLHERAVDFAKRKISMTHLVFDQQANLAGYFTIANRPLKVKPDVFSNTDLRKLRTHGSFDEAAGTYSVSAFLIAQIGKNYECGSPGSISGNTLIDMAVNTISQARRLIGGGVIFLEAEDNIKLLQFYRNSSNRFKPFSERYASDGTKYIQLIRLF